MKEEHSIVGSGIEFLVFLGCAIGIVYISYWSFIQTKLFFQTATGSATNALYWSLFFQYGQNVFIFLGSMMRNKRFFLTPKVSIPVGFLFVAGFAVFAAIDAGTNVSQWQVENPKVSSTWNWYSVIMYPCLVLIVFVEEMLVFVIAALAHKFNDLLESLGFDRIEALDQFMSASGKNHTVQRGPGGGGGKFRREVPEKDTDEDE